jgi:uncharacterized membrane-anchored protein
MPALNKSANWYQHPTKKQVLLFAGLWLVGIILLIAVWTDFFTVPAKVNTMFLLLLVLPATAALVRLVANYRFRRPA